MSDDLVRSALPRYGRTPRDLLRDPKISDRAKVVYALLDDYAGVNDQPFPRRSVIAASLGCSIDTVDRAVAQLVHAGWVTRQRRFRDDGGQSSNLYVLRATALEGAADLRPPLGTGAAGGAAPLRPHEGEPDEGTPHRPPKGGEIDGDQPLDGIQVDPVGGDCDNGNMNKPVATATSRRREVADDDPHWSAFWSLYPRKVSKGAARKAWMRAIGKVEPQVIIRAVERFAGATKDLAYCPYPATWLNQEKWSDEQVGVVTDNRHRPPKKHEMCPTHDGEWATNCRLCASERIAKKDE